MIKLVESLGWLCVEGIYVIGYQIEEQWCFWVGDECVKFMDKEGVWVILLKVVEESKGINF